MTKETYAKIVDGIGTRVEVSRLLEINLSTLYRRIYGQTKINREMIIAITFLSSPTNRRHATPQ